MAGPHKLTEKVEKLDPGIRDADPMMRISVSFEFSELFGYGGGQQRLTHPEAVHMARKLVAERMRKAADDLVKGKAVPG